MLNFNFYAPTNFHFGHGVEMKAGEMIASMGGKKALIQVGINGADGHVQFRMVGNNLIGRLSLLNERGYDHVFLMQFTLGKINAGSGIPQLFPVFPVCGFCIVGILMRNRTVVDLLGASVTDIRRFIQTRATFLFEVRTGLVAGRTGSTFYAAKNDLSAGIGLFAVVSMDAEVLCIVKGSFVIPVRKPVSLYFLGNGGWILAQIPGNVLKGCSFVQFVFDILAIIQCKMFLVPWYILTHKVPPSTAVRRKDNSNTSV